MDLKHVEAAADAVVADTVTYVRNHPQYAQLVQALGEQAIRALAAAAGL